MKFSSPAAVITFCSTILVGCTSSENLPASGSGGTTTGSGGRGNPGSGGAVSGSGGASSGSPGSGGAAATGSGGVNPTGTGGATAGSPSGSGGSAAGGTGVSAGGGSTGASPADFFVGGYLQSGPWMGYPFTFADALGTGTIISPTCTTTGCTPAWGSQACVKGSVALDASSASYVGLAFHVINPVVGPIGTWPVSGTGLLVTVSNPPPGARVQLQEMPAPTNDQRYCAPLPAGGTGVIPFASFKTYCWGDPLHPSKVLAPGTRIHEAAVTVPGNATAAVPVDFCLLNIAPQ